jgi:hypothetical protein
MKPRAPAPASAPHDGGTGITDEHLDFMLELGRKRAGYMDHLKAALIAEDQAGVNYWGRLACGLEPEGKQRPQ